MLSKNYHSLVLNPELYTDEQLGDLLFNKLITYVRGVHQTNLLNINNPKYPQWPVWVPDYWKEIIPIGTLYCLVYQVLHERGKNA